MNDDSIKVFLRLKPTFDSCIEKIDHENISINNAMFSYDHVGFQDCSQQTVFENVGKVITDNCLLGYNGTIFAYGQTGSGTDEIPGLIPRTIDYLFSRIEQEQQVSYLCKCSYVEIYNEQIYDLLDPLSSLVNLREDITKGVYLSGNTESIISSKQDALEILEAGQKNRHVSSTAMNRESSRSHAIFTIYIQSKEGVDYRESRFNLVDLAGSERQQLTGTTGQRLKEAGNINKSLATLGHVINALVDLGNNKARHVHYRDSKLTFLLRDSLGGNAKTFIIANVSPAISCYAETLSTLKFAQRAKLIKNKAIVNKEVQGDIDQLLERIRVLEQSQPLNYELFYETLNRSVSYQKQVQHLQERIAGLSESLQRKDMQIQAEKMKLKFKENAARNPALEELTADLRAELEEQKRLFDRHPEVTRFASENLKLRDELDELKEFDIEKEKRYEMKLNTHILELKNEIDQLKLAQIQEYGGLVSSGDSMKLEQQQSLIEQLTDEIETLTSNLEFQKLSKSAQVDNSSSELLQIQLEAQKVSFADLFDQLRQVHDRNILLEHSLSLTEAKLKDQVKENFEKDSAIQVLKKSASDLCLH